MINNPGSLISPGPGGGLKIFGCLWRIASDDLVFPAWIEFFARTIGLAALVGVFAFEEVSSKSCAKEFHLDIYLMVAIVLFALMLVNLFFLAWNSAKGHIWDPDPQVRALVVPLIYLNMFFTLWELVWALTGSVWVVKGLLNVCTADATEITITDVPIYVIFGIIIATWVGLGFKTFLCVLSFSSVTCISKKNTNDEAMYSNSQPNVISRMFSLCMKKTKIEFFKDIAKVLSEVFDDPSFVPTDIAAGLILLHAKHQEASQNQSAIAQIDEDAISDEFPSSPNNVNWKDPSVVKLYLEYAGAAYGYTWLLMKKSFLTSYTIYPYVTCFACCCPFRADARSIESDNCFHCNYAALRVMLPFLDTDSLVHISFKNEVMEVAFFVALDHQFKKIVISVRGTLSLQDALTDLCAHPECMDTISPSMKDYYSHSGMLKAAKYVCSELRDKNILNDALSYHPDYKIVTTGHSLGAGTAVLVAFILRELYPTVKCYAYSPPGGLLNESAARESENFTLSVIAGKDLVSRLSLHSLDSLKAEMKQELLECKLPKYQILASGLSACCIKDWDQQLVASSPNASSSESNVLLIENEAAINYSSTEHSPDKENKDEDQSESRVWNMKMMLPGKIWFIESDYQNNFKLSTNRGPLDFQDIIVSPKMLTDHFPNNVSDVMCILK